MDITCGCPAAVPPLAVDDGGGDDAAGALDAAAAHAGAVQAEARGQDGGADVVLAAQAN